MNEQEHGGVVCGERHRCHKHRHALGLVVQREHLLLLRQHGCEGDVGKQRGIVLDDERVPEHHQAAIGCAARKHGQHPPRNVQLRLRRVLRQELRQLGVVVREEPLEQLAAGPQRAHVRVGVHGEKVSSHKGVEKVVGSAECELGAQRAPGSSATRGCRTLRALGLLRRARR